MDNRPNIKSVAELAGVSISTVSRVLNQSASVSDELREKVMRAISETGYSISPIASSLKTTRRNQMAIVIPSLRQTYYTDIIKGISDFCYERGVLPVILESSGEPVKERRIIKNLEKQWLDGIIFIPTKQGGQKEYEVLAPDLSQLSKNKKQIPVVLLESDGLNASLDCVRVDYRYAFAMLASHLIETGHRKIAYLCGQKDAAMYKVSLEGIRGVLDEEHCTLPEENIMDSGFTVLEGYHAMNTLLDRGVSVDGVICANDQMASGALWACREREIRIPQEIALVGFGGVALSSVTSPSITTMIVPRYELGYRAAELMFQQIDGVRMQARTLELRPYLSVRESTLKTAVKTLEMMFTN